MDAARNNFAAVCINPSWVKTASLILDKIKKEELVHTKVCTVIGFPLGSNTLKVKAFEASEAINDGAEELDVVINIGYLKDGRSKEILKELEEIVKIAAGKVVKVIIEMPLLTKEELIFSCKILKEAGVNYVKTSTGFNVRAVTVEDIKTLKKIVGDDMLIKASGGIKDTKHALELLKAGASRLGSSKGLDLLKN